MVSGYECCQVDQVAEDTELRGEGGEGLFGVHGPCVVDNVGYTAHKGVKCGRWESKVWLRDVDLEDGEFGGCLWGEGEGS